MVFGILNPFGNLPFIGEEEGIVDKILSIKTFIGLGLLLVILSKAGEA
jgi:hypothetical protein